MTFDKPVDRSEEGYFKVRIWASAEGLVMFNILDSRVFEQTGLLFAFGMSMDEFTQMAAKVLTGEEYALVGLARKEEKDGD